MRLLVLLLLLSTLPLAAEQGLNLRVSPAALIVGQSVWLTCRVTPDASNRKLHFGIAGSTREDSQRDLEGSKAAITWGPYEVPRVPCNAGPAYCVVDRQGERPLQAMQQIYVGGCDQRVK